MFAKRLIAIGLTLMIGFWAIAGIWLSQFASLSSEYSAACTPPTFPMPNWPPATCTYLSAQMGEASTIAFIGGVAGFAGLIVALFGVTREPEP